MVQENLCHLVRLVLQETLFFLLALESQKNLKENIFSKDNMLNMNETEKTKTKTEQEAL